MIILVTQHSEHFSAASRISVYDVAELAQLG